MRGPSQRAWVLSAVTAIGLAPIAAPRACASDHAEPPVEIYTRLAKGALTCWFGTQGSLKKTHIFHADVAPEAAGGAAEITIQQRDPTGEAPRAFRAFRISITPTGSGSKLEAENFRFPADMGRDMEADVRRWAGGDASCSVIGAGGWTAKQVAEPPPEAPKSKGKASPKGKKNAVVTAKEAQKTKPPAKEAVKDAPK